MVGQVAIEHSHRLLGTVIGCVCIAIVFYAFKTRKQSALAFKMSLWLLGLVIFQGVLGGVTVLLKLSPIVSTAHLATSQVFIASIFLFWVQIRSMKNSGSAISASKGALVPSYFEKLSLGLLALVFLTMCWGAFIRHGGAAVACGLGSMSVWACVDGSQGSEAMIWPNFLQAQVHMIHRYLAVAVALLIYFGTLPVLKWAKANNARSLRLNVIALHGLVTVQVVLGLLTVYTMIHSLVVTLHLVFGMCLWLAAVQFRVSISQYMAKSEALQHER
jgi:cytochrome c oxidase assembly protein subunit 15